MSESVAERERSRRITLILTILATLAAAAVAAYLFIDLKGSWAYALDLRTRQVLSLVVVGTAVGVSSLVFTTIAGSRILTPGVMGFDALYLLIQTVLVTTLGTASFLALGDPPRFLLNIALLSVFGLVLFRWLFTRNSRNLFVLVLIGVVLGALFSSLTTFASRLLSPGDFLTLQDVMFASFTLVSTDLLVVTAVISVLGCAMVLPLLRRLDVVELGYDTAVSLGVGYHRVVTLSLVVVTVLVASATALVGPLTFLGLIVANLARQLLPTGRHAVLVPAAALIGVICTVVGQTVVAHVFGLTTTLSVVVNLVGGIYFLILLSRTARL